MISAPPLFSGEMCSSTAVYIYVTSARWGKVSQEQNNPPPPLLESQRETETFVVDRPRSQRSLHKKLHALSVSSRALPILAIF